MLEISYNKVVANFENNNSITTENKIMEIKSNEQEVKPKQYKKEGILEESIKEDIWQIEIPKINLIAPIAEDTTEEIMNKYVGHFKNTEKWNGNVGFAAHNRRIFSKLFC